MLAWASRFMRMPGSPRWLTADENMEVELRCSRLPIEAVQTILDQLAQRSRWRRIVHGHTLGQVCETEPGPSPHSAFLYHSSSSVTRHLGKVRSRDCASASTG